MRALASIKTISAIEPIENKDRIVLATVDGWNVIVKKDEYNVGDRCVYVEIDSVLPERPEFEFLRSKDFRIKTIKMAGVVSQGICFPMSILPSGDYSINQDVTAILGVKQYEATIDTDPQPYVSKNVVRKYPQFLMRMKWFRNLVLPKKDNKEFPTFISKTDEIRIQNIPSILKDKETKWVITEKVDGQSGTFALVRHKSKIPFMRDKFEFIVCSRNRRLPTPDNSSYWSVARKYNIERVLRYLIGANDWVAIQGECIGPKIQKNKYKFNDFELLVFNLIFPSGRMPSIAAEELCEDLCLNFVPILANEVSLPDTVEEVLAIAHGKSRLCYDMLREGVVFRSADGVKSFKAVDPLFLLKHDE